MKNKKERMSTNTLVMGAILTALVVILQFMGAFIRFGPFSISLVLLPIVIGAATCGTGISTWLGLVFGAVVLASGDAAAFLVVDAIGTVITVLVKGSAAGLFAGLAYKAVLSLMNRHSMGQIRRMKSKHGLGECCEQGVYDYISGKNKYIAVLAAAIVCPVVNTGIFLLGCRIFFMETVAQWAAGVGLGANVGKYMIVGLVGANFLFEMATNLILSPVVVRIVGAKK